MTSVVGAIRLGTRASRLAGVQTEMVRKALARLNRTIEFRSVELTTEGDRDRRTPLPEIGGKGVFTQELEQALREGTIDLAVHSLKDVPVEPTPGLTLAAIGMREDPREVWISARGWTLATIPAGAKVGTCSTRRAAQLLVHRPDLRLASLRGNVDTRIAKVQAGEFDAIVIAAAGVHRLGLTSAITEYLPLEVMLPAPGQGALAVQCRADDSAMRDLLRRLDDTAVRSATDAERAFLEGLGGGCAAPIAAFGEVTGDRLYLRGLVLSRDGKRQLRLAGKVRWTEARLLGLTLAAEALAKGAEALLP
ncbi:MAG TPA: hydroxymethylbilane synthase [Gemmatimonadales bacterium]|nr:hydroxymethylbilane synthase [Gemmatimonadales bacterium]